MSSTQKFTPVNFQSKSGKNFIIRHLTEKDGSAFIEFNKQVALDSTHTMKYVGMPFPSIEEQSKRLQMQHDDDFILSLGVFDQDHLMGHLVFYSEWKGHPWIQHSARFAMMILKPYWGMGLGKKLLSLQDEHARKIGVSRIEALVRSSNESGIKLYLNNGFEIEGTRKKAAKINGAFQDEFYIGKILGDASASSYI